MTATVKIAKIVVQPDKDKPLNLNPVELEVLHFKRAIIDLIVKEDENSSQFACIIEFRRRTITIARKTGRATAEVVYRALAEDHAFRYGDNGLEPTDISSEEKWQCTLTDPESFLGFLHVVKQGEEIKLETDRFWPFLAAVIDMSVLPRPQASSWARSSHTCIIMLPYRRSRNLRQPGRYPCQHNDDRNASTSANAVP